MNLSRFLPLLALALLPGCQTAPDSHSFPTPGPGWKSSVGQLQYANPTRSVIGDAVVSHDGADNFALEFTAGPGVPLMRLRESGSSALAEGVLARGSWQGSTARAGRLASWISLREAFASLERRSSGSAHSAAGSPVPWTAQAEGPGLHRVRVEFPKTNERFVFVLN
jgi:hypothetical protein